MRVLASVSLVIVGPQRRGRTEAGPACLPACVRAGGRAGGRACTCKSNRVHDGAHMCPPVRVGTWHACGLRRRVMRAPWRWWPTPDCGAACACRAPTASSRHGPLPPCMQVRTLNPGVIYAGLCVCVCVCSGVSKQYKVLQTQKGVKLNRTMPSGTIPPPLPLPSLPLETMSQKTVVLLCVEF